VADGFREVAKPTDIPRGVGTVISSEDVRQEFRDQAIPT